jgi:hypothetical protein
VQRQRHGKCNKGTGTERGDQHGLRDAVQDEQQYEYDAARERALQQVAADILFSYLTVKVQGAAPDDSATQSN